MRKKVTARQEYEELIASATHNLKVLQHLIKRMNNVVTQCEQLGISVPNNLQEERAQLFNEIDEFL